MANTPCYNCDRRTETCHSECEEYLAWAAEREEFRNRTWADKQPGWDVYRHRRDLYKRVKR